MTKLLAPAEWPTGKDAYRILDVSAPDDKGRQSWLALWWDDLGSRRGQAFAGNLSRFKVHAREAAR